MQQVEFTKNVDECSVTIRYTKMFLLELQIQLSFIKAPFVPVVCMVSEKHDMESVYSSVSTFETSKLKICKWSGFSVDDNSSYDNTKASNDTFNKVTQY